MLLLLPFVSFLFKISIDCQMSKVLSCRTCEENYLLPWEIVFKKEKYIKLPLPMTWIKHEIIYNESGLVTGKEKCQTDYFSFQSIHFPLYFEIINFKCQFHQYENTI